MPYNVAVRRISLHRSFGLMAAFALLLILLAPLVSRWMANGAEKHHEQPMHAVEHGDQAQHQHHSAGHHGHDRDGSADTMMSAEHAHHSMATEASPHAAATAGRGSAVDPHAEHEMGVDCDYCLIAARMISLLVALLLLLTLWPVVFRALTGLVDTQRVPAPGTLGARGPPVLVLC